ncbi:hypothetical protein O181_008530 [Austropuccinia psidii MF-1]|uniref:Uncharacterized protein n=1 Tax=Austropuccinia psidii MF-1 TaxID=1389203 RepID=A0A9Q3BPI8_9BASI|nr:hypothetical protein [Austropuccinia psidii MF-1]
MGDLFSLSCCRKPANPIPLSVATNAAEQSFVTGVGRRIYPRYQGKHIIINSVFYSPDSTSKFILPGTLVSAGAKLCFVGLNVLIGTEAEGKLFQEYYSGNSHKWHLPVFSRLPAHAIDNHENTPPYSPATISKETISTIELPCAPVSAMSFRPKINPK